jgi:small subunit ribosomal protein S13
MRFFGYNIADNTTLLLALSQIYGIGKNSGLKTCKNLGFSTQLPITLLNEVHIQEIQRWMENNKLTELELRKKVDGTLKNLQTIHCYRGMRHRLGLPVRGQRTHSNAKTQKKRAFTRVNLSKKSK